MLLKQEQSNSWENVIFHSQIYICSENSDFTSNVMLSNSTGKHGIIAKGLFLKVTSFTNILHASNLKVCEVGTWGFFLKKSMKEVIFFQKQAVFKAILSWLIHEYFRLIGLWSNRSWSIFSFCHFCWADVWVIMVPWERRIWFCLFFLLCY